MIAAFIIGGYAICALLSAYLFARATGDLESAVAGIIWPIALPVFLFFCAAILGVRHSRGDA